MDTDAFDRQTAGYLTLLVLMAVYEAAVMAVPLLFYAAVHLVYLRLFHVALKQHGRTRWWLAAALVSGPLAGVAYSFRDQDKDS